MILGTLIISALVSIIAAAVQIPLIIATLKYEKKA